MKVVRKVDELGNDQANCLVHLNFDMIQQRFGEHSDDLSEPVSPIGTK
jgi:hypothetical protein